MFETYFRSSHNKRLSEVPVHLPSQEVEVVSWRGALGKLIVYVLGGQVVKLSMHVVIGLRVDIL